MWNKYANIYIYKYSYIYVCVRRLGVAPSHDASDHQNYYVFRPRDP